MTSFKSKFTQLDEAVFRKLRFGVGSKVNIEGKGSVKFMCKNGEKRLLHEVFYIPDLRDNIINIG